MVSPDRHRRVRIAQTAFTLTELAIVLSIVGVLAAVGGSRYTTYLERARETRAIVELRGIAALIEPLGDDDTILPETLAERGLDRDDPWGNPYQYLLIQGNLPPGLSSAEGGLPPVAAPPADGGGNGNGGGGNVVGQARKDRFLVPINSDFDLFSLGPDGDSKPNLSAKASRDDVIRAANGAYYGRAETF